MTVGAAEPEEPEDERLADDDTEVVEVTPEMKLSGWGTAISREESRKLSETMWEEYAGGMTQQQIADLHGVTRITVTRRIRKLRKELGIEDIEEAKALDLGRYEALIERVWKRTFDEPNPENVRSLAMLMDQRAKLLGLNAPRKLQVDGRMEMTPSPTFLGHLDRLVEAREALRGETSRPEIEASDSGEILDAELVDDDG